MTSPGTAWRACPRMVRTLSSTRTPQASWAPPGTSANTTNPPPPPPRLVDIDWRRHITLVMACALRRVRGLDFRGYNRLLCHGWFLSFCKRRGARLAYLHGELVGLRLCCLRERHRQQSMDIISLDVVLVHCNGQLNMPHQFACGPVTPMERLRV